MTRLFAEHSAPNIKLAFYLQRSSLTLAMGPMSLLVAMVQSDQFSLNSLGNKYGTIIVVVCENVQAPQSWKSN